ncbi:PRC-barrel domain-containing protein [Actinoplanes sp. TRM 88003]|uniref:PRC-barrel domain-containing protein n=1 Tax=Paractinoplanes aksuensis TaxID=2939490 RepID=A0ABT1DT15_9ACTN|nr:PRC-barrel domain-containing protein [Actinoplanes aksuensis]MCO8273993.1 PRC-barrel domain-containing protein [Actinoplanes aksuensis]
MNSGTGTMIRLGDGSHLRREPAQDVRGHRVVDCEGKEIGRVDELLIDPEREKVQLLQVEHGGLFGVGAGPLYIPADCVDSVTEETVRLDRTRVQVAGAPADEPLADLYEYYGIEPHGTPDRVPWTAKLFL